MGSRVSRSTVTDGSSAANRGQHALEAGLAVGVDVQLVTAQLEVCPDPLHAVGDHVLEPHQRAVRLAIGGGALFIQFRPRGGGSGSGVRRFHVIVTWMCPSACVEAITAPRVPASFRPNSTSTESGARVPSLIRSKIVCMVGMITLSIAERTDPPARASISSALATGADASRCATAAKHNPVRNGHRWRVAAIDPMRNRLAAERLDDRARVVFEGNYLREYVTHGYAVTVHAAQGVTADTSHAVLGPEHHSCAAVRRDDESTRDERRLPLRTDLRAGIRTTVV